jgi:hypothetical protein
MGGYFRGIYEDHHFDCGHNYSLLVPLAKVTRAKYLAGYDMARCPVCKRADSEADYERRFAAGRLEPWEIQSLTPERHRFYRGV